MTTVYDVPSFKLIKKLSEELKNMEGIKPPEWAGYVKTGGNKKRQPQDEDWWYVRVASILRKVYVHGPVGIPTLKRWYGSRKNRGVRPDKVAKGSGSVIRNALKDLETAGLVSKEEGGRKVTPKGISLLDNIAHSIKKDIPELENYR